MSRRPPPVLVLCATLAAATGCTTASGPNAGTVDPLAPGEWVVEDIDRTGIIDNSRATLDFRTDGSVGGRGSCNAWSGSWERNGNRLRVSGIASTMMACAPALMDQEQRFFAVLNLVAEYHVAADGALVLSTADGRTVTARR